MKKLKPIEGRLQGCLHAGVAKNICPLSTMLAVGFGEVTVSRNGKPVWAGDDVTVRLRRFEMRARKNPGDWRVYFDAPLSSKTYQRHTKNKWVLVAQGHGFA